MRKTYTLIFVIFYFSFYNQLISQEINNDFCVEQPWIWSSAINSEGNEGNSFITTDVSGNVFAAGNFEYSLSLNGSTYQSKGTKDIYIIKYNEGGAILWTQIVGSKGFDNITAMAADAEGNLYATGTFSDTLEVSGQKLFNHHLSTDIFLAKFNAFGELVWLQQHGGALYDFANDVVVGFDNKIYLSGQFEEDAEIGGVAVNSASGGKDFLLKINSAGSKEWLKQYGNTSGTGVKLGVTTADQLIIGGTFSGAMQMDGQTLESGINPTSFLAGLSSEGDLLWLHKANNGASGCELSALAINSNNEIYIGGSFFSGNTQEGFALGDSIYDGTGGFIAKFSPSGQPGWSKRISNSMFNYVSDLAIDPSDNVYATGLLSSDIEFADKKFKGFGGFVAKFNATGKELKLWSKGSFMYEISNFIVSDRNGNVYTTGVFEETIHFGDQSLNVQGGYNDAFIAKLHPGNSITVDEPQVQTGNLSVRHNNGTSVELEWENGDGSGRILVAKKLGKANVGSISDGEVYSAGNGHFGSGSNVGTRQFVVYSGNGSKTIITGLEPNRIYTITAFEYNVAEACPSAINYNTQNSELVYINTITNDEPANSLVVYPNPVGEEMNIIYSTPDRGNREFVLLDEAGRQLHKFSTFIKEDVTKLNFNISRFNLSTGTYYLKTNDSRLKDKVFRILKM